MGYVAVLIESPAKCNKIEKFLGAGYRCKATYGHFRTLSTLEDIDVDHGFRPKFKDANKKTMIIRELTQFIRNADSVIIATDDDREGEAIGWHICDKFGLDVQETPRMIYHEVTETALVHALNNTTRVNMELVQAQQARQILDLLVGFTISPILWKHIDVSTKVPLSAGRCQTPALRLVYDNQISIERSPGEATFSVTGHFTSKNIDFGLNSSFSQETEAVEFLETSKLFVHELTLGEPTVVSKDPPLPFNTSTLQQKASAELRFTPKQTMELCQTLYEAGHITYMRTDAQEYAAEFVTAAEHYIGGAFGAAYVRSRTPLPKKGSADTHVAHEAIRPTHITGDDDPGGVSKPAVRLYKLIHRNTLQSCMASSVYSVLKARISAPQTSKHPALEYRKTLEEMTFEGWEAGLSPKSPGMYGYVLALGSRVVHYNTVVANYGIRKLRNHLSEAKLVQLLEAEGIGRPSTFSSLVEKVQSRGYVNKENVPGREHACPVHTLDDGIISTSITKKKFGEEKSKLVLQPLGRGVIEFLIRHFDALFQFSYTHTLEKNLDKIANGESDVAAVCGECKTTIDEIIAANGFEKRVRIPINATHTYVIGKYGPVVLQEEDGRTKFHPVKDGVKQADIDAGLLTLAEIIVPAGHRSREKLGTHEGDDMYLHQGRFGPYVRWNGRNYSCRDNKAPDLAAAIELVRPIVVLSPYSSIRRSKHGAYIYFKKPHMPKPTFTSIPDSVDANDVGAVREWIAKKSKS